MSAKDEPHPPSELVILDWKEIEGEQSDNAAVVDALEAALGAGGIGLVAIRNVPGFVQAKEAFLPLAHDLIRLPADYLEEELTDEASLYNAGWSHGKEKLGDKPDLAKGSYYFNPVTDLPGSVQDRATYPLSYPKNVWPDPERLASFREKAVAIGSILKQATVALSKHIDALASRKVSDYPKDFLYQAMKDTDKVKARLLYYYPIDGQKKDVPEDSWIGWHNDSGFLTALAGDMYLDHGTGRKLDNCPDPKAGLYVVGRGDGPPQKIDLPEDCLAVQMGECTQIVTGGAVAATPHCVRGVSSSDASGNGGTPKIARISLPCFVDTPPFFPLAAPKGCSREQVLAAGLQSRRVPPLETRWKADGMTFGDFLQTTFSSYYDWNKKSES